MSEDPWSGLSRPVAEEMLIARRVDAELRWDFFWAVDADGRCLLVLQHTAGAAASEKLPRLKGIELFIRNLDGKPSLLTFRLLDSTHRDIFERLCRDIVERCAPLSTEAEVLRVAVARTWRWHHLLRGGDGRLSEEEQKGLIGELLVLERLLIPMIGAAEAVMSWRGPTGAPKDFEVGRTAIEAKARRGAATPFVTISSEHQLDTSGVDALFLHVLDLSRAPAEDRDGLSVTDVAHRVRARIESLAPVALEQFDALLSSAGLDLAEDYQDFLWLDGEQRLYRVERLFPRITGSEIPSEITAVRYALALHGCEAFLSGEAELRTSLEKEKHGNGP